MRPHEAKALAEARERGLRFAAIRDWATYAVADPKLHQLAATAIRRLAVRLTVDGAGATDERSPCSVETESAPERRSERQPGALANRLPRRR